MNIIYLETPLNTEKYYAPRTDNEHPFFITEYGKTMSGTPCYQLRMNSPVSCVQYVVSGSGVIICDDRIYTVNEGDTFLLPEGSNQIYYSNPDNCFERIWLNFKGELSKALIDIYKIKNVIVFKNTDCSDLLNEMQILCKSTSEPQTYKNESSVLFLKLVQFLSENKNNYAINENPIDEIRLYIDCHITENLKLSDVADNFSLSKEHIIRIFKKTYGITPHQYIIQSKIRIAMIMLKSTDNTIEEISDKLSFSDPHHFSFQFQKHVGCRPSQYRKNAKADV